MVRDISGLRCRDARMDARAEVANGGLLAGGPCVAAMLAIWIETRISASSSV
jgi:hypothetical protein